MDYTGKVEEFILAVLDDPKRQARLLELLTQEGYRAGDQEEGSGETT